MAALSPKMTELREKYKDDPTKMNEELMKLYRDYGVNPFSGCLPMLIQIPIFFGFYGMLGTAIELRNSSFLWIHDLSQPDTIAHIMGFPINILPPSAPPVQILQLPATGGGSGRAPAPYVQPAPWRQLTADDVAGVWLGFGVGMDKQYFVIRKDGDRLFGLACGRCDNPYTFGALENFAIHGDTLEFDIEHQDWGEGRVVPFVRHVTAHIAMNEMRIDARRADVAGGAPIIASLVGPIAIEATKGNVVGE